VLARRARRVPFGFLDRVRAARVTSAHRRKPYGGGEKRSLSFAIGLAGVALFLWWGPAEGGYAPTAWYPGALLVLALLALVLVGPVGSATPTRWAAVALALFASFTAWSFFSLAWAGVKGDAWDGANRTLLYLTVYAVFALPAWRAREAALVFGLLSVGTAAVGAAALAVDGASAFVGGRLAAPTDYANASAALFLTAFWPAVALAAHAEVHWAARSLLFGAAGVLLQLALLAQSRGSLVAGAVSFGMYVLVSRERLRALLALLPVVALTLPCLYPLLDVYASSTGAQLERAVAREQQALAASTAALLAVGALVGALERGGRAASGSARLRRVPPTVGLAFAAAAVLVAFATAARVGVVVGDRPDGEAAVGPAALGTSRFAGGLESGRYDLWRVAAGQVAERPLVGAGVDNFAVAFVRERRTNEEPLYPHSVVLRAFSQTGIIGGALFLGFLGAALIAAFRPRAGSGALSAALVSAALASAAYWLVHASVDWLWELPALTAPVLAYLGISAGLGRPRVRRPGITTVMLAAIAIAAATTSYALPGLAALEVERAAQAWPEAPEQVFSRLERARSLNRLSERPDVVAGTLALRSGHRVQAQKAFRRALERHPADWHIHLELALLEAAGGRRTRALEHLRRARSLNPREPVVRLTEAALTAARPAPRQLVTRLDELAVRSPLGRRSIDCRPILGLAARCTARRGGGS
jgi:tetratricopeptide (TPR) repeat protein